MTKITTNTINKKKDNTAVWLIILLIILVIIVFIFSFGKIKSKRFIKLPPEFKDSKEETKRKHEYFKTIVSKQKALDTKLNRKFKISYFIFRLLCIIAWFGVLIGLYFIGLINNLGDILSYSEAGILIMLIFHFLIFGSFTNLESFINTAKMMIENYVYRNNLSLKKELEYNKQKLLAVSKEIKKY